MSAEMLRQAAAKMRADAEAATPGAWRVTWYGGGEREPATFVSAARSKSRSGTVAALMTETGDRWGSENREADAEHIASWHPLVAFAVADWLNAEARFASSNQVPPSRHALAVARAYLGES